MGVLKLFGVLAAVIFLLPFIWTGLQEVQELRRVAGAACILDGDQSRRLARVYREGEERGYALTEGGYGACGLSASVESGATWDIEGEDYRQGSGYTVGSAFPSLNWNWPFSMTWDKGMSVWTNQGWLGQTYAVYLRFLPAMLLLSLAGLALFIWAED